jgi:hypothetical protein
MELKVTKERVLAAAGKCGQAKEVLKSLFPEAFVMEQRKPEIGDVYSNSSLDSTHIVITKLWYPYDNTKPNNVWVLGGFIENPSRIHSNKAFTYLELYLYLSNSNWVFNKERTDKLKAVLK